MSRVPGSVEMPAVVVASRRRRCPDPDAVGRCLADDVAYHFRVPHPADLDARRARVAASLAAG